MNARKDQKLIVFLFCGFLAVMLLLYLVLPPKDFSQLEKRYLADTPELTLENVLEGGLMDETADYMADHMPFRDVFVGLNAYYDLLSGRQATKDIYLAAGERLVEAPVVWDQTSVQRNMTAINAFAAAVDVPVDLMLIPSAGWAAQDTMVGLSNEYSDDEMIAEIYSMAEDGVQPLSVTDAYAGRSDLFYKTDHHWNSLGAWTAYYMYSQAQAVPYRESEEFAVEIVEGFRGSTYSRSGLWLTSSEPIELWHGSEKITVTNGESKTPHEGVFYRERLDEADMYTVYLDGNHSTVVLENPDALIEDTLLVVRDSYSNSLGIFLSETYSKVVLVDLRYYRQSISQLCEQEGADRVLVCYSIGNFMSDTNIVWLK